MPGQDPSKLPDFKFKSGDKHPRLTSMPPRAQHEDAVGHGKMLQNWLRYVMWVRRRNVRLSREEALRRPGPLEPPGPPEAPRPILVAQVVEENEGGVEVHDPLEYYGGPRGGVPGGGRGRLPANPQPPRGRARFVAELRVYMAAGRGHGAPTQQD